MASTADAAARKSFSAKALDWIERTGNRLPDPVFIFVWLIAILVVISVIAAGLGASVVNPVSGDTVEAKSLLSSENLKKLFVDMAKTMTGFAPLGYVLIVMLGAGVAERTGLLSTAMRSAMAKAPKAFLTPVVVFLAIISNHAADAAYVVLVPLAAIVFAAAGRHPIAGITAAFAGVSGGFSANLTPGQLDTLILGITEPAARLIDPNWVMNPAGNWWFIVAMTFLFTPIGWYVTDKIVEPRLGPWKPGPEAPQIDPATATALTADERKGLGWAGLACLGVIALFVWMVMGPDAPLVDRGPDVKPGTELTPFYQSLVAGFFLLFLAAGVVYGIAVKTVKTHRDVVRMMTEAMAELGPYLVLAFVAAHFVAMVNWSNLGIILAVNGASALQASGLPTFALIMGIVILAASVNLFIGSASAKWGALAPILVPMMMLIGVSPEMTTAAYRMGDSVTNIITPLMVYFPLVLTFCQKWNRDFGLGNLMALMIPYSLCFLIAGLIMTGVWAAFAWPVGPAAPATYVLPTAAGG